MPESRELRVEKMVEVSRSLLSTLPPDVLEKMFVYVYPVGSDLTGVKIYYKMEPGRTGGRADDLSSVLP